MSEAEQVLNWMKLERDWAGMDDDDHSPQFASEDSLYHVCVIIMQCVKSLDERLARLESKD